MIDGRAKYINTLTDYGFKNYFAKKEVVRTTISISIIKLMLFTLWHSKEEKLTDEDIRNVLYSFSRLMEHDETFITT